MTTTQLIALLQKLDQAQQAIATPAPDGEYYEGLIDQAYDTYDALSTEVWEATEKFLADHFEKTEKICAKLERKAIPGFPGDPCDDDED